MIRHFLRLLILCVTFSLVPATGWGQTAEPEGGADGQPPEQQVDESRALVEGNQQVSAAELHQMPVRLWVSKERRTQSAFSSSNRATLIPSPPAIFSAASRVMFWRPPSTAER